MTDHTIEAKFTGKSVTKHGKPPVGNLIAEIADALRAVAQLQCADEYERHAQGILAALAVLGKHQAAAAAEALQKLEADEADAEAAKLEADEAADPAPVADDVPEKPAKPKGKAK